MDDGETWAISEYQTPGGDVPVMDFLRGLASPAAEQAAALLKLLREQGNRLRPPHSKLVESGIWELRRHQVRIFYTFRPGRRIVLLDGMLKKQDQIPATILKRVRGYLRDLEAREEAGG